MSRSSSRQEDERMQTFLQWAYARRLTLRLALLTEPGTILDSLTAGLAEKPDAWLVRVILGDTLIQSSINYTDDFV